MTITIDEETAPNLKTAKKSSFGFPGEFAIARNQVGGDICAAALLYRLKYRWRLKKKLERFGKEWIAMSRRDWAREAGLTFGEIKNRALPKIRNCGFVEVRAMKITPGGKKLVWMSLDVAEMQASMMPSDMYESFHLEGMSTVSAKCEKTYPYSKGDADEESY